MQKWWVSWPMAVSLVVSLANVEIVLIPLFVALGVSGFALFVATAVSASVEVAYWYWFAGWLGRQAPFIPSVGPVIVEFRGQGYATQAQRYIERGRVLVTQMWVWFTDRIRSQMVASSPLPRWLLGRALQIIRTSPTWFVYPVMVVLGLCPLGWIPGILICRQIHARGAFVTLLAFNAIKTYGIGLGWTEALRWISRVL